MTIVYTQRGFALDLPLEDGVIYESPIVTSIWQTRRGLDKPNFSEDLVDIAFLMEQWNLVGGMFRAYTNSRALVVSSTQGFIVETASILAGKIRQRRVGFNDWALLLAPAAPRDLRNAIFTEAERASITFVSNLSPEILFKSWIQDLGLTDLVDSMQLFVGTRDENGR